MQKQTSDHFEQMFSDFLDSKEGDELFQKFQDILREIYLLGYQTGHGEGPPLL